MSCHLCQAEAVSRCHNCGVLVCAEHGKGDACPSCTSGFVAGDPRQDRISAKPLAADPTRRWWRPQQAEEYVPPACYQCQGLTRLRCHNCESHFCKEHAGPNGLCNECGRSANLGLWVCAGVFGFMAIFFVGHWLFGK